MSLPFGVGSGRDDVNFVVSLDLRSTVGNLLEELGAEIVEETTDVTVGISSEDGIDRDFSFNCCLKALCDDPVRYDHQDNNISMTMWKS